MNPERNPPESAPPEAVVASTVVRPALLQALLMVTSTSVAAITAFAGVRLGCTALVEFGMVSAIVAISAGLLFVQFALRVCGVLATYRHLERWDARARMVLYVGLGAYALWNGTLDLALRRFDSDPLSYPGLACALGSVLVVALVLELKYRVLQTMPSRLLLHSLTDDTFYLTVGLVTLGILAGHLVASNWWLDTTADLAIVALIALRLRRFGGAEMLAPEASSRMGR